jgi:hypothetical protein
MDLWLIGIVLAVAVGLFFAYCLCRSAADADERIEKMGKYRNLHDNKRDACPGKRANRQ